MSEFKVGDKVRVIAKKPEHGWAGVTRRDVGKIIRISSSTGRITIDFDEIHSNWDGYAKELEMVEPALYGDDYLKKILDDLDKKVEQKEMEGIT